MPALDLRARSRAGPSFLAICRKRDEANRKAGAFSCDRGPLFP
jgi:hypothetical protein